MIIKNCLFALSLLPATGLAGSLVDGQWTPSHCERPEIPSIDGSNAAAFNQSVGIFNAWQRTAQRYKDCLAQEANADNASIAGAANQEQAAFNEAIDRTKAEADQLKAGFDGQ